MTIIGAHTIIFSTQPEADRVFLRDVLHLPNVDAGEEWLIFGLPPAELAVHPYKRNNVHQFYLICDDVAKFTHAMKQHGVTCDDIVTAEWGRLTYVTLPGGGKLGVYQPLHSRPPAQPPPE
ncbi:MAG TPA: hypothetical protein VLD65_13245 [Anaerolineales bacterium]|nr:hypothetical protein [Anaerolineales bacterium]